MTYTKQAVHIRVTCDTTIRHKLYYVMLYEPSICVCCIFIPIFRRLSLHPVPQWACCQAEKAQSGITTHSQSPVLMTGCSSSSKSKAAKYRPRLACCILPLSWCRKYNKTSLYKEGTTILSFYYHSRSLRLRQPSHNLFANHLMLIAYKTGKYFLNLESSNLIGWLFTTSWSKGSAFF